MQIFNDFGVNPVLLGAQILNFFIIFYLLKRFMYKPVLSIIQKRQKEVEEGLKDSEKAKQTLLETEENEKKILQKAQIRADKIISDTKADAMELRSTAEEATKKDVERMLEQAREQINQETKAAEEKLTKNIGSIAVALLEKSLIGVFGEKEQKIILEKANKELQRQKAL